MSRDWLRRVGAWIYPGASGPAVAVAYQRAFALLVVIAWLSLGAQVQLLIGREGLLPLAPWLEAVRAQGVDLPLLGYPSLLRWPALAGDGVLLAGTRLGLLLGLVALAGFAPRACFAASTVLYLGYAAACRTFLSFQWDNLLLECGLLAAFLPQGRPAPLVHLCFRVLLFKLYFESGLAKWDSPLRDWHDGSAMTFYYETAPLPTALGFFAHDLPAWWHHLESRATLVLELVVPFAIFGPRRARLGAAIALTGFQVVNAATANYGFFCPLAVALHLFLLDDADLQRPIAWLRARLPARVATRWLGAGAVEPPQAPRSPAAARVRRAAAWTAAGVFLALSLLEGLDRFGPAGSWQAALLPLQRIYRPLRLVNVYHLFASITRERVEPQFETRVDGVWREQDLRHKAGDPARAPGFVAPHQPRVDFQLWFYGLAWQRREPPWVSRLLAQLCAAPARVQPLFRAPLPRAPQAVRISYYQYRFSTAAQRRAEGVWWRRNLLGTSAEVSCDR